MAEIYTILRGENWPVLFVFSEWSKTPPAALKTYIFDKPLIYGRPLGGVMSKTSTRENMTIDSHAFDRMAGRLTETESRIIVAEARKAWFKACNTNSNSVAVIALQLTNRRTLPCGSTGDLICGVVRFGVLKTVFVRGSNQQLNPAAFRTDRVVRAVKVQRPRKHNGRRW